VSTEEIIEVLRANIDQTIKVTHQDGDVDVALVINVDDEGFVFDLASVCDGEQKTTAYWTRFTDSGDERS
jgi:hypothetical protein